MKDLYPPNRDTLLGKAFELFDFSEIQGRFQGQYWTVSVKFTQWPVCTISLEIVAIFSEILQAYSTETRFRAVKIVVT